MTMTRRLSLKPEVSEVTRMNTWLDQAFTACGVAKDAADGLRLCLNEAVANVISYAFEPDAQTREIDIELSVDTTSATAVLIDNGIAFNPLARPAREKYTALEDAEIGGFGVQLIRERASELAYQRIEERNRLRITCEAAGA